jgi:hypothetical protein
VFLGAVSLLIVVVGGLIFWLVRPSSDTDSAPPLAAPTTTPSPDTGRLMRLVPACYPSDACKPVRAPKGALAQVSCEKNSDLGGPLTATHTLVGTADARRAPQHGLCRSEDRNARSRNIYRLPRGVPRWVCSASSWQQSGLKPTHIQTATLYDHFTPYTLIQLEELGFCGQGEAKDFIADGAIEVGGRLPINTHGGQLGEAYIHGMNGIAEGVRQLRGTSVNQVDDVEHVLVTAGTGVPTSGLILSA